MFLASIFQLKSNLVIPVYHFENKHFTLFCRTTLEVYLYQSESGSDVASFGFIGNPIDYYIEVTAAATKIKEKIAFVFALI